LTNKPASGPQADVADVCFWAFGRSGSCEVLLYLSGASAKTLVGDALAWLAAATLMKKSMQGCDNAWIPAIGIGLAVSGVACLTVCPFLPA
jgi:hypothetical protein